MKKYYWSELFTNIKGRLSNRIAPSWLVLNIDLWISFLAILSAYLLRFNFAIPYEYKVRLLPSILLVIVIKAIFFYYSRLHVSILRYTSIRDLFKLFIVVFLSDFVILGLNFLHSIYIGSSTFYIPTSILIIDFFISVYVMVFFRMLIKIIFSEIKGNNTSKINTIIYDLVLYCLWLTLEW